MDEIDDRRTSISAARERPGTARPSTPDCRPSATYAVGNRPDGHRDSARRV